jgi:V/A-type H+-transporting ATPase subunit C
LAKLKETDYLFASARIRSVERNLFGRERIDKMVEAKNADEAVKVLYECEYGEQGAEVWRAADFDQLLTLEQKRLYSFIMSIAPKGEYFSLFFYPYDYHNVKVLLKAEQVEAQTQQILLESGNIPVAALRVMVRERNYISMTERMRAGIVEALDVYARTCDPQTFDLVLDKACYEDMIQAAGVSGSDFLRGYVAVLIDALNLKSFVRIRNMGKSWDFFNRVFLSGGNIPDKLFVASFDEPLEQFAEKLMPFGFGEAVAQGAEALKNTGKFTRFEKLCDDRLMAYVSDAKYTSFGIEPLVGYLVAKENDIKAARIILSGKLMGLAPELIRERLRNSYV